MVCLPLDRQVRILFSKCIDSVERKALARSVARLGGAVAPDSDENFTHFVTVPCSRLLHHTCMSTCLVGPDQRIRDWPKLSHVLAMPAGLATADKPSSLLAGFMLICRQAHMTNPGIWHASRLCT